MIEVFPSIVDFTNELCDFSFKKLFFLFCAEKFNISQCFLYISIYFFVSMKRRSFTFFEEFVLNYKLFKNLTINSFLRISFYTFIFNRRYFVDDFYYLLNDVWICIIQINKIFIIRKLNFTQSFFITINCIVILRTEFYFFLTIPFSSFHCFVQ